MLIDTHCHIDRFPDPLALSRECEKQNVFTIAVTNLPSHFQIATDHLSTMQYVKPALGFHPLCVADNMNELPLFDSLLQNAEFVGEIGLDYSKQGIGSKENQLKVFRTITQALSTMPRFATLHSRNSATDVLAILKEYKVSNAVFHWYSDSVMVLRKAVDAGFYFSINPAMLLSKSGQAIIDSVPRDRILTETDGPYVKAGREPAKPFDVRGVISGIACRWGVESERVEEQVTENFQRLCERLIIRLPEVVDSNSMHGLDTNHTSEKTVSRTIAIGDIHGCSIVLEALIESISPQPDDTIIPLGDYVDRGIDSKGVLDQLIELRDRCNLVPILGNHDQMMLYAREGRSDFQFWLNCGGDAALDSYGSSGRLDLIPRNHIRFLESCRSYFETDTHVFLHANYKPDVPVEQLDDHTIRWLSLRDYVPSPHCSGKVVVVGHTPQTEVLDLGYLICLDTGVWKGGWLTALDVESGKIWQVSEAGSLR